MSPHTHLQQILMKPGPNTAIQASEKTSIIPDLSSLSNSEGLY